MNIAFIPGVFFPQPGGAQVQVNNFANKLIENGLKVDCLIYRKANIKNTNYNIIKCKYVNRFILTSQTRFKASSCFAFMTIEENLTSFFLLKHSGSSIVGFINLIKLFDNSVDLFVLIT